MTWFHLASFVLGGAFLTNAIPPVISGLMGRPFRSTIATLSGESLSSASVSVLWGFVNLVVGYLLLARVGEFDLRDVGHVAALGLGVFLRGVPLARRSGRIGDARLSDLVSDPGHGVFRSLKSFNYRVWAAGAFVSNIGTWVQRTAQDWLVLTVLTHHSASAVGTVMALQFGPQLFLLPWTGYAADHLDQRKILIAAQTAMGIFALALGLLTVTGAVQLWHVYVFAVLLGSAAAFDAPVRQTFVAELVGDENLANALALNSTSFNAARMIGPAVSGLVIAAVGTGWAFLLNGVSFVAVPISLCLLRAGELHTRERAIRRRGSITDGFRYVWSHAELKGLLLMLFLVGTFGLNFSIFISTMAVAVFDANARDYGLLSASAAVGTVVGALLSAGRRPRFETLIMSAGTFGLACTLAAIAPSAWTFAAALAMTGVAALTFINTSNSLTQLSTEPAMRGRVTAIRAGVALGGIPIGAPVIGWTADHLGPRWAVGVGAMSGFAAAIVGIWVLVRDSRRKDGAMKADDRAGSE